MTRLKTTTPVASRLSIAPLNLKEADNHDMTCRMPWLSDLRQSVRVLVTFEGIKAFATAKVAARAQPGPLKQYAELPWHLKHRAMSGTMSADTAWP